MSVVTAPSVPWAGAVDAVSVSGSPSASSQNTLIFSGLPVRIVSSSSNALHTGAVLVTVTVTVAGSDWVTASWPR